MRIAVIGSTGRTGRLVVEQAHRRGHDVIAVARHPDEPLHDRVTARPGDVLDADSMVRCVEGADAVVSAVGAGTSRAPTEIYSRGVANIVAGMSSNNVATLTTISAAPAGPRDDQPLLQRRVVMPILDRLFGSTYADMRRMESGLQIAPVEWVCLRPPRLVGKPPTGRYRLDADRPPAKGNSITHADLAAALLDCLGRTELYRRSVWIAN